MYSTKVARAFSLSSGTICSSIFTNPIFLKMATHRNVFAILQATRSCHCVWSILARYPNPTCRQRPRLSDTYERPSDSNKVTSKSFDCLLTSSIEVIRQHREVQRISKQACLLKLSSQISAPSSTVLIFTITISVLKNFRSKVPTASLIEICFM